MWGGYRGHDAATVLRHGMQAARVPQPPQYVGLAPVPKRCCAHSPTGESGGWGGTQRVDSPPTGTRRLGHDLC
jgi:hypothetical protein